MEWRSIGVMGGTSGIAFGLDLGRNPVFPVDMKKGVHARSVTPGGPSTGLARALSKLGFCSRSQAWELVEKGRVRLNGRVCREPEQRVSLGRVCIQVDGREVRNARPVYIMLNKPRGLVTTAADEKGRATVFQCLEGQGLPFVAPVGRLDQASEGLLLFTNDTRWGARISDPDSHLEKVYHVQVDCRAGEDLARRMVEGLRVGGELLAAKRVSLLRQGQVNSWLEVVLEEGKNRHIRRLLGALGVEVLRLIRVAIGPLVLGNLGKGQFRYLSREEAAALAKNG